LKWEGQEERRGAETSFDDVVMVTLEFLPSDFSQ
jgi:hypothetical protein